jgi:protein-tyrosine kinase
MTMNSAQLPDMIASSAVGGEDRAGWRFPERITKELAVLVDQGSRFTQSVNAVAAQIQHMYVDNGIRSFCFIGDERLIGTTVVAANAAAAFALGGARTILLETNLRAARLCGMFGLDARKPGLSEWLAGIGDTGNWSGYMQPAYPNLMVMCAGNAGAEGEAAMAIELRHAVIELTRMFDVVICDAAPMSDVAGALPVVAAVERTVIVARANKTKLKSLFGFQEVVRQCGGQIGGTVYLDF